MRKNAFTLIELLAVIVILAIIALIAVPIVINIINDAKSESLKRSVQSYLDAVTNTITKENLKHKYNPDECVIQEDGNLICSEKGNDLITSDGTNELEIQIKGKKPKSGTIRLSNGKIVEVIDLELEGRFYKLDENNKLVEIKQNTLAPGLYDENNKLILSWDGLIENEVLYIDDNCLNFYIGGSYIEDEELAEKVDNAKTLVISPTITEIGDTAFDGDHYTYLLENIILPKTITTIGWSAFCFLTHLKSITIPNSVTSIGGYAFEGCMELTEITLPSSVTTIESGTFQNCRGLTSLIIPSSVTSIGYDAFWECTSLANIIIPDSVTSIGESAFYKCTSLTSITISNSVTTIGYGAFEYCTSLTSITIPSSVTSIGYDAFWECTSLANIIIPDSVTSIGESAFYKCTSLTTIVIPNSVTSIEHYAFHESGLTNITIPSSVTSIENYAFLRCDRLTSVTFENTTGWKVNGETFDVTDPERNGLNLRSNYYFYDWVRE